MKLKTGRSKSLLITKEIEDKIKELYNPDILRLCHETRISATHFELEIHFEKSGFPVVTPVTITEEQIIEIASDILVDKNIDFEKDNLNIVNIQDPDAESYSLLFKGVSFVWTDIEIEEALSLAKEKA